MTAATAVAILLALIAGAFAIAAIVHAVRAKRLEVKGWNYHAEFEWPRATQFTLTAIGLLFLGLIFWLVA